MKILWITLESIVPLNSGGRIGVYKRLEQIAKTDDVYLFYPFDDEDEYVYAEDLRKICKAVYPYSRKQNRMNALFRLWKYPFTVSSRMIPQMQEDILNCIETEKIDLINVDFPHMCANLLGIQTDIPIILNEHNIEWKVYKNISRSSKNPLKKMMYFIDAYRLKKYEAMLFHRFSFARVTFVSSDDMHQMLSAGYVSSSNAVLIPVGADIHPFKNKISKGKDIIFVGKMSYGPNIEAVRWFTEKILPHISKAIPGTKFYIVGKDPSDDVKNLQAENVVVTGRVEDVEEYYANADLVVLPLKNGGGVKVKLLEAVSYRKPVVSSSVGVEGTFYSENFIPVADDALSFADFCIGILSGKQVYPEKEVYMYFLENYTWEHIGKKYHDMMYEALVGDAH